MPDNSYSMVRGTFVSLASSIMFGAIYFVTPMLAPLTGLGLWSVRITVGIPLVIVILIVMRQLKLFTEIYSRIKKNPWLILGIVGSGFLLSLQLWIFAWAPLNGRGLQVALGYFLLPLVLVLVGRFVYRDQLKWWHWIAALTAAVGVTFQIINLGGVSLETLLVCLGYPLYFILRKAIHTASTGGLLWEYIGVVPVAITMLVIELTRGQAFQENTALYWFAPVYGVLAGIAFWFYVLASRLLPISIFGLLSYVEPALLVVASLLIGERISENELFTYIAIWLAVLILLIGGVIDLIRSRGFRI